MSQPKYLSYPFMRSEFLQALETSKSASQQSGWQPIHLALNDADQAGFMPLYLKDHSMGEYVFDHSWANAYHENGLEYFPKLVTAIPFTPSTGPRIRGIQQLDQTHCMQLFDEVLSVADETQASSWHMLFPQARELELFADPRLLQRSGVQYHWYNHGYNSFDDFLARMNSRKRKMVRKERAEISRQNISVDVLVGAEIDESIWALFYQLYERTYAKRNGTRGYLTRSFFNGISNSMPEQIAMAVASQDGRAIACALYFFDSETLYGRYWGSVAEFSYLHFELCYYRGIEFAIERGLQRYDAGAQGEHKLMRGFEPIETHSLHWIRHPQFRDAIAEFLGREQRAIADHIQQAEALLPFKKAQ
ncbi:GNAT family N-acetyltransferase [SAR92 clade bacterium H921]|jgi:predicted N-acyltransferase|nr:GNAT family N-acetyltransferase [SAR92 clade bacterium H921]